MENIEREDPLKCQLQRKLRWRLAAIGWLLAA
jgi:hypothetical protein